MRILVTGSSGFIGKNLIEELKNQNFNQLYLCDRNTEDEQLNAYCKNCEFVFHLAGVNRPQKDSEFMEGNCDFLYKLLSYLKIHQNPCPVMLSSSIQAEFDNPYGKSKLAAENRLLQYGKETKSPVFIFRLPNVFGKWCRPNYNSVIATFCFNIANNLPITISDENKQMNLVYIDDLIQELLVILKGIHSNKNKDFYSVKTHQITLGEVAGLLYSFKQSRETLDIPDMTNSSLIKKLYSTYLSYLPADDFAYPLKMNEDSRGSFTEILRTSDRGQFSVNISKPGIEKGNHWHHTKCEKFVVVSGKALIQFRKIGSSEIIDYHVSGEVLKVIDIPPGYTHNIINVGKTDLVTFMWCNECYCREKPDTYFLKVNEEL